MKITPKFVFDFESNLNTIIVNEWGRIIPTLWWDRIMKLRPSSTFRELIAWVLTTAQIHARDGGGNIRFDDMVAHSFFLENEDFGAALKLTKNEISDEQIKVGDTVMRTFDWAGAWARQIGGASAYWPQKRAVELLKGGLVNTCYDGQPFFSANHPINPYTGGGGLYANLFTDLALDSPQALAEGVRRVKQVKMPGGVNRHLVPRWLMTGPDLEYNALTFTEAQQIDATDNSLTKYGIKPFSPHELDEEGVWYLVVEDVQDGDLGPLIYQEREAFELNSYSCESSAALSRRDEFEWHLKGRNTASYGHPYLIFRFQPTP